MGYFLSIILLLIGGLAAVISWGRRRWQSYEKKEGMLIPSRGEACWLLPEGPLPYWRGSVVDIQYTYL